MSRSLNKVTLIGNLGADPEVRSTAGGSKVANFSVATSRQWTGAGAPFRSEYEQGLLLQSYEQVWPEQPISAHGLEVYRRRP